MLDDEERRAIGRAVREARDGRAAIPAILGILQRRRGWVPDEAGEAAALAGVSATELLEVASFYSHLYRRPVGRHVILSCDGACCWAAGQAALATALQKELGVGWGETSPDGLFTLLPCACLGACDRAPALMVDDQLVAPLEASAIPALLARFR